MYKRPIANEYSGFYRGTDTYPEVWATRRLPARRFEIGMFYKPAMVRFDDGELLCMPFRRACVEKAGRWYNNEHFVPLSSLDEGQTWQEVGERIPGREARLQLLNDGTLTTTCHLLADDVSNDSGLTLMGFMRSEDRGRTWERQWLTLEDVQPEAKDYNTSRNVLEMPDGSILLGVSSFSHTDPSFPCGDWFFRSTDGGKTWPEKIPAKVNYRTPVNNNFFCETDMVSFESGRILCMSRFGSPYPKKDNPAPPGMEGGTHLRIFALDADTLALTEEREFLEYHKVHPHLLKLRDGRLLCCYGVRHFPFGAQAIISSDEGRTWSEDQPYILSWFSWNSNCGYPNSVEMPDGSILTAYTMRRYPGDRDITDELFSEVVRWHLDEPRTE